jgi:hypothetical protein
MTLTESILKEKENFKRPSLCNVSSSCHSIMLRLLEILSPLELASSALAESSKSSVSMLDAYCRAAMEARFLPADVFPGLVAGIPSPGYEEPSLKGAEGLADLVEP